MGKKNRGKVLKVETIRELLRLLEMGCKQVEISEICNISRYSVQEYQRIYKSLGITAEELKNLEDQELFKKFGKCKKRGRRSKSGVVEIDWQKVSSELKRKGVTLELLWLEWIDNQEQDKIYSYSNYCRNYRLWKLDKAISYRQEYHPGEFFLADYAGLKLTVEDLGTGEKREVPIFVCVAGFSNYKFVEATENAKLEHWLGSNQRALEFYGGCPKGIKIDNLKTGVNRACRYEPELNKSYAEFAEFYKVAILPCRVCKPKDKAKAEKAVQDVERWILAPLRDRIFYSVGQINAAIKPLLEQLNNRQMKSYQASPKELFEKYEKNILIQLPLQRHEYCEWKIAILSLDYHIQLDNHYYSAPYYLVRQKLWVKILENIVEIYHDNKQVAVHPRSHKPFMHSTQEAHLPPQHLAIKSQSQQSFISWGKSVGTETLRQLEGLFETRRHPQQAFRSILGIQRLAKQFGNEAMEIACKQANLAGVFSQRYIRATIKQQDYLESFFRHENIRGTDYYN